MKLNDTELINNIYLPLFPYCKTTACGAEEMT